MVLCLKRAVGRHRQAQTFYISPLGPAFPARFPCCLRLAARPPPARLQRPPAQQTFTHSRRQPRWQRGATCANDSLVVQCLQGRPCCPLAHHMGASRASGCCRGTGAAACRQQRGAGGRRLGPRGRNIKSLSSHLHNSLCQNSPEDLPAVKGRRRPQRPWVRSPPHPRKTHPQQLSTPTALPPRPLPVAFSL